MTETQNLLMKTDTCTNFELFFELSPNLLCISGFDGYFKTINPSVSKLLGYTDEELLSNPIIYFVYFEDRELTLKVGNEIKEDVPLLNFENRFVTKNGEIVWLSWTSMPIYTDKLVFAIAKNITEKKKLEEERNLLLTNLTKVNNNLKELTYTTSHDLRSPINNLLFVFDLIDVSKIEDKETLELIGILKSAGENLRQTLNEYIDVFNKDDSFNVNVEELNLNESLNVVLQSINSLIQNSKAEIKADFSEVESIKFNKAYLKSIFLNLITNSIKYARADSLPVISIYSRKVDGVNQLVFSDNGLGFDMDKVKGKLFGLNQKFHNHIDSKGIGLYLVYNHITSLGGHIEVESKVNDGTKFILSFKD